MVADLLYQIAPLSLFSVAGFILNSNTVLWAVCVKKKKKIL